MKTRSHRYSKEDDEYIDSTHYDSQLGSLDIGFQRLKIFDIKIYPDVSKIKSLFIHQNNLTALPDTSALPYLTELDCSNNNLKKIPFYHKLHFLNVSYNKIVELNSYHNSCLDYLDCSFNSNVNFDIHLPCCKHLYINDTKLSKLNLGNFNKLQFLDCSNNNLSEISVSNSLLELNIQNNQFVRLQLYPKLSVLIADHNFLVKITTYPFLKILNVAHNKLIEIESQPRLEKITASHNVISKLGYMPNLEIMELDNNKIQNITISDTSKHVCIQFNPICNFNVVKSTLQNVEELHVDYQLYENIYAKCYDEIKSINIYACENKIDEKNKKLAEVFNLQILKYIKKMFVRTKFEDKAKMFTQVTLKIKEAYFGTDDEKTMHEKCLTTFKNISKLYHKIIVVTLIFSL